MSRLILGVALAGVLAVLTAAADPVNPMDQAKSQFAKADGAKIHYKSLGKGKTALVFIHGWCCDMTFWREQVPAFDGQIRIILLDLPGHGQSDKPQVEYTMGYFARAVKAVLRDAKVDQAILVGHSMGMPVARQFYRLYPNSTRALVSVDGALRPYTLDPERIRQFTEPLTRPDFQQYIGKMVDGMFHPESPAAVREQVKAVMQAAPQYVAVSAFRHMFDAANWLADPVTVPLLAVYTRSPVWNEDYVAFVRQLAPDSDIQFMDGVGHFLMLEKPAEFNEKLKAFVARQGPFKN